MTEYQFEAIGTVWHLLIDDALSSPVPESLWQLILAKTDQFDRQFSRFIEGSEVTAFRHSSAGTFSISAELTKLLVAADHLRTLTYGTHDPAVGTLLEAAGYNQSYDFQPNTQAISDWRLPIWSVDPDTKTISIDGPVVFDIGGTGKGYWIDRVSQIITTAGYPHHLVDGGGDMMATTKADGSGWFIALEWPGRPDTALGSVTLKNQGLAASDTLRRSWATKNTTNAENWHHLLDIQQKKAVNSLLGCTAIAKNAWVADQVTAALSLVPAPEYPRIATALHGEYLVLETTSKAHLSPNWPGELY